MDVILALCVVVFGSSGAVLAEYDCACNYNPQSPVFSTPSDTSLPIGFLNMSDCKPEAPSHSTPTFSAIQFRNQYAYVNITHVEHQKCPGVPLESDIVRTIPISWPAGRYGLMKPATGCPESWEQGSRKYDTEDSDPNNVFSVNIGYYLNGDFLKNNLRTYFCIKTSDTTSSSEWPSGSYCILRYGGHCPSGFRTGRLYWDDEDDNNGNDNSGVMPDGDYNSNTKIYYCCRNDGNVNTKIALPSERPFVLLRQSTQCQSVNYMIVTEVFIRWDDEDVSNHDTREGMYPCDDGGNRDHLLYFCHYTPRSSSVIIG